MKIFEELKKPHNLITLALTILSISLSIYFYVNSLKVKDISYVLNNPPSIIYDSQNYSSEIKLLVNDSLLAKENVYLLTGTIWNSGELSIYANDVRKDIELNIGNENKILDYKITKTIDEEISGFNLTRVDTNSLLLGWDYFDPDFGFNFQIIYMGNEVPYFNITGKILDIKNLNQVVQRNKSSLYNNIVMALVYLVIFFSIIRLFVKKKFRFEKTDLLMVLILLILVLVFVTAILPNLYLPKNIPL
ncbi:hypothetical protein [Dokdonia sp. 4H-3-7-5]|uniref:hypothetical protein n=1 Tax=Dokdonia sp. (strain 4H-3-7-5) TaxID=983548 RepID=UPI00020A70F6|nr:hypothetical protein [Dokdonia sp. 4H-3-7-5]AEE18084.1 hypothetical protein Krodi_0093 [Dokdonia sp. 4H-3-7-5]